MALRPPDESDLASVAERYGLELSSDDVASFAPFATACWARGPLSRSCTR